MKIVVFAFFLILTGCFDTPRPSHSTPVQDAAQPAACPTIAEIRPKHVVVVLFDRSGSVHDVDKERLTLFQTDTAQLVHMLPPATLIFGSFISEQSYTDQEEFLRDAIPAEPQQERCEVSNKFDVRKRRQCKAKSQHYERQMACVAAARSRIAESFKRVSPAQAPRTDIFGGLMLSADVFRTYEEATRYVILYSDMRDTVRTALPLSVDGLQGARIIVRTTRTGNPAEMYTRLAALEKRFAAWESLWQFQPLELPLPQHLFTSTQLAQKTN